MLLLQYNFKNNHSFYFLILAVWHT